MTELPAPLVPAEVDLRDFAFMPLDVARLMDSDLFAVSTGDEFKAAVALWCKAWGQVPAASVPDDERVLAHLSGAGRRWSKVREVALRGWVKCSDGRLYHPVVAEKANDAWEAKLRQRERTRRATEARTSRPRHETRNDNRNEQRDDQRNEDRNVHQGTGIVEGTGREERKIPEPNGSGAPVFDPLRAVFGEGLSYLKSEGVPEKQARAMLGKWRKVAGDGNLIVILTEASRQSISEPIPWIERAIATRSNSSGQRQAITPMGPAGG